MDCWVRIPPVAPISYWVGSLAVRSGRACARYHPLVGNVKFFLVNYSRLARKGAIGLVSRVSYAIVAQLVEQQAECASVVQVHPIAPGFLSFLNVIQQGPFTSFLLFPALLIRGFGLYRIESNKAL